MAEDCSYCSCSMTAADSYCSCDRSIVHVLDLATPRFDIVIRQPSPPNCRKLFSKRSSREYKSMMAAEGTNVVDCNSSVRKQFAASTEELHRSPADHHCRGQGPLALQVQNSRSEVVPSADRGPSSTDGPDLLATDPQVPDLQATDQQAPDFCTTELQVTDQLQQEYNYCATYEPHVVNYYANDFFAVITPNASDDFDAVDLTKDDYYRQRSVDSGGWEESAPADSAQARYLESGMCGPRVQVVGDAQKEKISLWIRFKKCICRGLCCQQH